MGGFADVSSASCIARAKWDRAWVSGAHKSPPLQRMCERDTAWVHQLLPHLGHCSNGVDLGLGGGWERSVEWHEVGGPVVGDDKACNQESMLRFE